MSLLDPFAPAFVTLDDELRRHRPHKGDVWREQSQLYHAKHALEHARQLVWLLEHHGDPEQIDEHARHLQTRGVMQMQRRLDTQEVA